MEVAEGETYSRDAFESYFFAADVIIGVLVGEESGDGSDADRGQDGVQVVSGTDSPFGPSGSSKAGNPPVWENIIVGSYYVRGSSPTHSFNRARARVN